jgi:hypothetical protein
MFRPQTCSPDITLCHRMFESSNWVYDKVGQAVRLETIRDSAPSGDVWGSIGPMMLPWPQRLTLMAKRCAHCPVIWNSETIPIRTTLESVPQHFLIVRSRLKWQPCLESTPIPGRDCSRADPHAAVGQHLFILTCTLMIRSFHHCYKRHYHDRKRDTPRVINFTSEFADPFSDYGKYYRSGRTTDALCS